MRHDRQSSGRPDVQRLLDDGLDRYRYGDVDGALETWERALALDPEDFRAAAWVEWVRARLDGDADDAAGERLVPFGLAGADDGADYHVEIEFPTERMPESSISDGWPLELEAGASATLALSIEPPERGELFGDDGDATTDYASLSLGPGLPLAAPPDDSGEATLGFDRGPPPGPLELDLDLDLGPLPAPPPRTDYARREVSAEITIERAELGGGSHAGDPATLAIHELTLDLDPGAAALELGIEASVPARTSTPPTRAPVPEPSISVEELRLPPPPRPLAPVDNDDEHLHPLTASRPIGSLPITLLAEADRGRAPDEQPDDAARRRITWLIERARVAAQRDERDVVAAALDLALAESPDSAVAQKLIHRHRDLVLDCYYRYLGALDRRPVLGTALNQTTGAGLDPRAAFLLSRIDGMLTYDELLDVAGMGRLEACRHLVALVGRGLVRTA